MPPSTCPWVSVVSRVQKGLTVERSGLTRMLRRSNRRPEATSRAQMPISMISLSCPGGGGDAQQVASTSTTITWSRFLANSPAPSGGERGRLPPPSTPEDSLCRALIPQDAVGDPEADRLVERDRRVALPRAEHHRFDPTGL